MLMDPSLDSELRDDFLVEAGELDGDAIHTPSIFVKRIFQGELYERRIERRTVRKV